MTSKNAMSLMSLFNRVTSVTCEKQAHCTGECWYWAYYNICAMSDMSFQTYLIFHDERNWRDVPLSLQIRHSKNQIRRRIFFFAAANQKNVFKFYPTLHQLFQILLQPSPVFSIKTILRKYQFINNFQNKTFQKKHILTKSVVLSVRNRTNLCVFAHFFAPPYFVFSFIINTLTFWHDFCSIINI